MEISSERVDDIPLIVEMLKQMKIAKWIDQQLKQPHGNHHCRFADLKKRKRIKALKGKE